MKRTIVYLLDTNIISEPTKKQPNQNVLQKLKQHNGQYAISSITWHELNYGVDRMPIGKRKSLLQQYLHTLEKNELTILPYDKVAARWLAIERHRLISIGSTPAKEDSEIAAIAITNKLILATRNTTDFESINDVIIENWFL
jgi:tRNA(fMet)-specific endonuclease VapC